MNVWRRNLFLALIIVSLDWNIPFELIYDESGVALSAMLGQAKRKLFNMIYYASKMLNLAQNYYIITEQKLLVVVYAFEKFRAYPLGSKWLYAQIMHE